LSKTSSPARERRFCVIVYVHSLLSSLLPASNLLKRNKSDIFQEGSLTGAIANCAAGTGYCILSPSCSAQLEAGLEPTMSVESKASQNRCCKPKSNKHVMYGASSYHRKCCETHIRSILTFEKTNDIDDMQRVLAETKRECEFRRRGKPWHRSKAAIRTVLIYFFQ